MQFSQVAKEIITNTINAAYCIDDEFVEPFTEPHENSDIDTTRDLYRAFQNKNCALDIGRFQGIEYWQEQQKKNLKTKDLLVLDWELSTEVPKYEPALKILHDAIQTDTLPFVCIYTNAGSLSDVEDKLIAYFCNPLAEEQGNIEELKDTFTEKVDELLGQDYYFGEEELSWLIGLSDKAFDAHKHKSKQELLHKEIKRAIHQKQDDLGRDLFRALKTASREIFSLELCDLLLGLNIVGKGELSTVLPEKIDVDIFETQNNIHCLLVDSTVVMVLHKSKDVQKEAAVSADDLFGKIAEIVHDRPNNFMSLLSLEYRNFYRDNAKSLGKELNQVKDDAFFWHQRSVSLNPGDDQEFEAFLKEFWRSALSGNWDSFRPEMLNVLNEYKKIKNIDNSLASHAQNQGKALESDLAFLNKKYSILRLKPECSDRLHFGDILKGGDKFYLCITAHCDCLRPDKIRDNYMFIESANKRSLTKGLQAGDTDYHSFIRDLDGNLINIEWRARPFTIYIPKDKINTEGEIPVNISGRKLSFRYVCTQKENYTQRIANHTYSFANRVGINFANLKGISSGDTKTDS
ncbi:response regulator receiver domain [Vibrio sp. MEBiC08052]|uniref:response regulator receiver domain n=1 Tax=Vibrio sp. MEBiC08052 TaxID=1761910 RepID=UPI0012FCC044|nr:response regulator receiver domain [Vibrio sp. MEBiC08052]